MPRIDTYDSFQVRPSAPGPTMIQAPNAPNDIAARQLGEAGQAVQRAGDAQSRILLAMQEDANKTRVADALNQYVAAQTDAKVEAMQLRGRNALERPDGKSLPDEFGERMRTRAQQITQDLGNDAQRQAFSQAANHLDGQFRASLAQHMVEQQALFRKETQKATIETAANRGALLWGDKKEVDASAQAITRVVADIAKDNGMSPEAHQMALAESLSLLHVGVMKSMIQGGAAHQAKAYYDENSATMSLQARATMQPMVKQANDMQQGEAVADAIWTKSGPRGVNDPVKDFDYERQAREALKDNPEAMKHAIAALRERSVAFNKQQSEVNAAGVNAVFGQIDKGVPLSVVRRSPEWLALPELKRHEINKSLQAEWRANAENALTDARRRDALLLLGNGDAYARVASPDQLVNMSRDEVIATRSAFGNAGMQHLVSKWESLQKPNAIGEARIDKEDFEHIAETMGLDPFNAKTPDKKRRLGELQFRVEQLIDQAQRKKGQPLTRPEKTELMQQELARTVTVPSLLFDRTVPVIQLSPEEAAKVVVPQADKEQISQALQIMYQRDPSNPEYAPTEANMRRLYLMKRSRAAALIEPKKQ